jgi:hypothetical protein
MNVPPSVALRRFGVVTGGGGPAAPVLFLALQGVEFD